MMNKVFTQNGWEDYVYWETEDKKTLKKINALIEDICKPVYKHFHHLSDKSAGPYH